MEAGVDGLNITTPIAEEAHSPDGTISVGHFWWTDSSINSIPEA
jgi:hypothetical protein